MAFKINQNECIGCRLCLDECPHSAIIEKDDVYVIDTENCDQCGICFEVCPVDAVLEE